MVANAEISQGQFLAQYYGELITNDEGERRELQSQSGFRYFFSFRGSRYWYDVLLLNLFLIVLSSKAGYCYTIYEVMRNICSPSQIVKEWPDVRPAGTVTGYPVHL